MLLITFDGPTQVVSSRDLHNLTNQGWVLVAMGEEEAFEAKPAHQNYQTNQWVQQGSPEKIKYVVYVVGKPKDSALVEAQQAREFAEGNCTRAREEKDKAEKLLKAANEKNAELEKNYAKANDLASQKVSEARKERELRNKLEEDIGKLREGIGARAYKEILDG